jgi:hypothetical protein
MRSTSDPNELSPLTELGNKMLQERLRMVPEFATSSRWGASAIVLQISEEMGFHAHVGFELRTPLNEPFQDVIVAWAGNREDAVRNAVQEWLDLALPPAMAIHSDKDSHARAGEAQVGNYVYIWRLAEGSLRAVGADAGTVTAELMKHGLFDRLNLASALPLQREVPWHCMKLHLARAADGMLSQECRLNDADWPAGLELLKRFVLPGIKPLEIKQYLFLRRTGKRAVNRAATGPAACAAPPAGKKPWWKVW